MPYSVSDFMIERLENIGLKHIFGVPGDYILPFFPKIVESKKLSLIDNVDEAGAGFAADGYARINGIGCCVVTYNVGALKLCNPIAGAYAERSPVVVISGAPGLDERDVLMHHMTDNFNCQQEVFKNITCDQAILDNPNTAGYEIDRCMESLKYYKRPVYIEIPRDIANKVIKYDVYEQGTPVAPKTDAANLEDALKEVQDWLKEAKSPVILAGVEIARCQLGKDLIKFAEKNNIPIASTLLSKSVVKEDHPLYIGVYAGNASSTSKVREMVENSDCLLVCGEIITEATFGYRPSKVFAKRKMITATIEELKVSNHNYPNVGFVDFCNGLFKEKIREVESPVFHFNQLVVTPNPQTDCKLTVKYLFKKINSILNEKSLVITDAGDSSLGSSDMVIKQANSFLSPAIYLSMGFAIPAAIGANIASEDKRPIVIVGDGAFQMSCNELSTMLRYNLKPIIFVINNKGFTTERFIVDGPFNDIVNWQYDKITNLLGGGIGIKAETEEEFDFAIETAINNNSLTIINCITDPYDVSSVLKRVSESLSKKVNC